MQLSEPISYDECRPNTLYLIEWKIPDWNGSVIRPGYYSTLDKAVIVDDGPYEEILKPENIREIRQVIR